MNTRRTITALALAATLPWFVGCAVGTDMPKPPVLIPFALQKAGGKVEAQFRITDDRLYSFNLRYMFREGDRLDLFRVRKLTGGYERDKNGVLIDPGVPYSLRLIVSEIESTGEKSLIDEVFQIHKLELFSWGGNSFTKEMIALRLNKGHYKATVISLQDVPELGDTLINFSVAQAYRGK